MKEEKGKIIFENGSEISILHSVGVVGRSKIKNLYGNIGIGNNDNSNLDNMRPKNQLPKPSRKLPMPECKPPRVDYDYISNIKHLIIRYNNKLNSLNLDIEHNTFTYDEGFYDGLITAIHDLEDMLKEMEV